MVARIQNISTSGANTNSANRALVQDEASRLSKQSCPGNASMQCYQAAGFAHHTAPSTPVYTNLIHDLQSRLLTVFCAALTLPVFTITARAQPVEVGKSLLEEVLVTAQKRTESLIDVPISIGVMDSEAIAKTGVRQLREVAEFIPNVAVTSGPDSSTAVRIRGVGTNTRNIGFDTRVGVYVDGVYLGQSLAQNVDILDLERIEVVRGPQGTQFGRNTVAGAINMISRKPTEEFEVEFLAEVGNYDSYRVGAIVNLPGNDQWGARFSFIDHNRDGLVDNLTTGVSHNERDGTSVRGIVDYAGSGFRLSLAGDYLESDRVSLLGVAVSDWSGSVPVSEAPGRFEIPNDVNNAEDREIWGTSLTAEMDLPADFSLNSITAYRENQATREQDTDHSSLSLIRINYPDSYEQFTQEFQLFSPEADRLSYVAGVYLYAERASTTRRAGVGGDIGTVFESLAPPLAPAGPLFDGAFVQTNGDVDTDSWALYVNGTFDLSERWTLGFGARYTDEERSVDYDLIGSVVDIGIAIPTALIFGVAAGPVVDGFTVLNFQDTQSYTDFSPTLSLSYALDGNTNLYLKYSEAFKSGGFNVDFVSDSLLAEGIDFDPETVESWELGIKGEMPDLNLRYSLIGFLMEFKDYQLNQFIQLANNTSTITIQNAAEVESKGLEAELSWFPSERLMLQAAIGYNDAEFTSFPGGGSSRSPLGVGADLSGNQLPQAPEWTSAFAAQYNQPLNALQAELIMRLDWTYTDSYFTTEDNISVATPGSAIEWGEVDAYSLLNGRIGLESSAGWSTYIWARNILDEEYTFNWDADFLGTVLELPGDPRTYGLEVRYRF